MLGEPFGIRRLGAAVPQRPVGHRIAAGRPTDAEVDPARVRRLQQGELLRDDQRRVVGQHHPAGTDPHRRRRRSQHRDQHGRVGRRDRRHVVVLGDPVPVDAGLLRGLRQRHAGPERVAGALAGADGNQIEQGNRQLIVHISVETRPRRELFRAAVRGTGPVHAREPPSSTGPWPRCRSASRKKCGSVDVADRAPSVRVRSSRGTTPHFFHLRPFAEDATAVATDAAAIRGCDSRRGSAAVRGCDQRLRSSA